MKLSSKIILSVAALAAIAYGALSIKYSNFKTPESTDTSPNIENKLVVKNAESMIGQPYFSKENPENPSCIDVYVRSAKMADDITTHAENNPDLYSRHNERSSTVRQNIEYLLDAVGITDFDNTPDNDMFARRIQNVMSYQIAHDQFQPDADSKVAPGCLIYFSDGDKAVPTHAGIVSKVDENGKPTEIIHASYSRQKVVRDPLSRLLDSGLEISGYGTAPINKEKVE